MKTKMLIEGIEVNVEIPDEEYEMLRNRFAKKTGYERVEDGQSFWLDDSGTITPYRDVRGDGDVQNIYDSANYYSNFEVANNNARADKLMRQLRRFAVEHREKEFNWISGGQKHFIAFNYETNEIYIDWCCSLREFGAIFFDSEATAELAIETFRDELLWYFTEYEDSL